MTVRLSLLTAFGNIMALVATAETRMLTALRHRH